jgi:tRNA A37 N6-isopentenylltransferase MiaA
MSLDGATEQIKIGTRQLARRQMKWLRRFPNVRWMRGDQATELLVEQALVAMK